MGSWCCHSSMYPLARNQHTNDSPGIFSCLHAGANTGAACISSAMNSTKNMFPACIGFVLGGMLNTLLLYVSGLHKRGVCSTGCLLNEAPGPTKPSLLQFVLANLLCCICPTKPALCICPCQTTEAAEDHRIHDLSALIFR